MPYNNLLAACMLVVLTSVVAVPRSSSQYLFLPGRGVLAIGTLVHRHRPMVAGVLTTQSTARQPVRPGTRPDRDSNHRRPA